MTKSPITTHVLDTSLGRPAEGVRVTLEILGEDTTWQFLAAGNTDADGRISDLLPGDHTIAQGTYRLTFEVGAYFRKKGVGSFYPLIPVVFTLSGSDAHYHVPLLLNPFGYSTYRGS